VSPDYSIRRIAGGYSGGFGGVGVSKWRQVELGEVITLQRGYDLTQRDRKSGTVPVVSSSGVSGYHNEAKVLGPGVVTGRYGTLGEVYYIEEDFWPHNTTLFVKGFHGSGKRTESSHQSHPGSDGPGSLQIPFR